MATALLDPIGDWHYCRDLLPFDLDGLAEQTGALARRRKVSDGENLLRLLLLSALPKSTLERAAVMGKRAGLANMSGVALFKRVSRSEVFVKSVFECLLGRAAGTEAGFGSYRLLAVDATCLCGPGASATDLRLHVVYDLSKGLPASVDLTDRFGGESLERHDSFGPGDLLLADRGYAWARSARAALERGASLLLRFELESMKLFSPEGQRIRKETAEALVPQRGCAELPVRLQEWDGELRAIGSRNPEGRVVWLLTNLCAQELPKERARDLYCKRWQVELFFKRLKSLLDVDELPTRAGPTARPWVWAKLVLCALAVLVGHERFSPWEDPQPMEGLCAGTGGRDHSPQLSSSQEARQRKTKGQAPKKEAAQATLPLEAIACLS